MFRYTVGYGWHVWNIESAGYMQACDTFHEMATHFLFCLIWTIFEMMHKHTHHTSSHVTAHTGTHTHTSLCLWPAWTVISPLDFRIRLRASAYSHQPSNYEILIIYVCFLFRSFRISITILVNGCNQVSAIFLDVKLKSSFGIRILLTSLTAYQLPISELKMKRHSRRSIYFWIWILWCWML